MVSGNITLFPTVIMIPITTSLSVPQFACWKNRMIAKLGEIFPMVSSRSEIH